MPRIQLLVVQPTPFCNIDCRYCYLPDRTNKSVVAEATLANLFSQVFASGWVRDGVTIVWHAGEPMVLPIDFYRRAFRLIDGLKPADVAVTHSFQTNGTLIDDAWCEFFAAEQISVGVSIDGPQRLHDINRRTRSGHGTFERTIAGIRRLRRHGVPFHVISVLSPESLAAPARSGKRGSPIPTTASCASSGDWRRHRPKNSPSFAKSMRRRSRSCAPRRPRSSTNWSSRSRSPAWTGPAIWRPFRRNCSG